MLLKEENLGGMVKIQKDEIKIKQKGGSQLILIAFTLCKYILYSVRKGSMIPDNFSRIIHSKYKAESQVNLTTQEVK